VSTPTDRQVIEAMLTALGPFLSSEARKSSQALLGILGMFPGQPLPDVEKALRAMIAESRTSVPALAERGRAMISSSAGESADAWLKDVSRLNLTSLKQLGQALGIGMAGTKTAMVQDLRRWAESRGQVVPVTAADRALQKAREYAGDLPERMRNIDSHVADEAIRRAQAAYADKQLGKDGFEAFARLLGITVSGTKASMLKQVKDFVNRAAVIQDRTRF
jgi:hypothetical protein